MVADDDINAEGLSIVDKFYGLDATVECDHQGVAIGVCMVYTLPRDTIAFTIAVRDVVGKLPVVIFPKEGINDCDGSGAVHIIVSIDHDALVPLYCLGYTLHRLLHTLHKERIMKLPEVRTEEIFCAIELGDTTDGKKPTEGRMYAKVFA